MYTEKEFMQVFGHISVFFATLDFIVTQGLVRLLTPEARDKAKIKTLSKGTLPEKLIIIQNLSPNDVIDPGVLDKLRTLLPEALEAGQKRNRLIHDQWEFNDQNIANGKIRRLTLRWLPDGRVDLQIDETTIDELYEYLNEIGSLQIQFSAIFKQLPLLEEVFKQQVGHETSHPSA
jgi:hypothetical protein